jgi:type IV pilus assembly protein PilV
MATFFQDQKTRVDGFTLIEILIAITIFAIGILGATSMQIMALHTNAKSNRTTEAYALASDQMEKPMFANNGWHLTCCV